MYTQIFNILIVTLLTALGFTALFAFGLFVWFFLRMLIAQQDGELFYRNKIKWSAALFGISIGGLFLSGAAGSILVSKVQENIDRSNDDQKTMDKRYGSTNAKAKVADLHDKFKKAESKARGDEKLTKELLALKSRLKSLFGIESEEPINPSNMEKGISKANSGRYEILLIDFEAFLKN